MAGNKAGGQKLKKTLIAKLGGVEEYRAFMSENGTKGAYQAQRLRSHA